ncbi:MAG: acyl-CoA/acyl-ACP dehydrogenase [Rhodobacteraceae bacterium]|nr:acyl-CoA/acyl-ACP dehydrogenase [Paracoccaceae bacterium]
MTLFAPLPRQENLVKLAEQLAGDVLRPRADEVDRTAEFPRANFDELAKAGLFGMRIPAKWGGLGADVQTAVMVIERLARACASTAMCFKMHSEATEPIWRLANPEQVEAFVKPIAAGKLLVTSAISEAGTGSHTWVMQSHATRNGDKYDLTEVHKGWVTSSGHADLYFTPVLHDKGAGTGNYTAFVIEKAATQWTIDAPWNGLGMRANASSPMTFKGSVKASRNRLGDECAWQTRVFPAFMPFSMITFAAVFLGIAEGACEEAMAHVTGRKYGDTGSPLAKLDGIQRYLGEMRLSIDRTRAFVMAVARQMDDEGAADPRHLIQCVCAADETALEVARAAMNIGGGKSYAGANSLGRYLRDAQAGSVMAPTDDVVKLRVGRLMLGLPQFG